MDDIRFVDADGALVTLDAGVFECEDQRNNGPAVLFGDGTIVTAPDKESLVAAFEDILAQIGRHPDPAPDTECRNCGYPIRYPNTEDGPAWVHRPGGPFDGWWYECLDEDGDVFQLEDGRVLTAEPASDPEAIAQPGDLVVDMHAVEMEYPELDQVVRVWEVLVSGHLALVNDHTREPGDLLVLKRHVPEGGFVLSAPVQGETRMWNGTSTLRFVVGAAPIPAIGGRWKIRYTESGEEALASWRELFESSHVVVPEVQS